VKASRRSPAADSLTDRRDSVLLALLRQGIEAIRNPAQARHNFCRAGGLRPKLSDDLWDRELRSNSSTHDVTTGGNDTARAFSAPSPINEG
jgi:hypothetical protein